MVYLYVFILLEIGSGYALGNVKKRQMAGKLTNIFSPKTLPLELPFHVF